MNCECTAPCHPNWRGTRHFASSPLRLRRWSHRRTCWQAGVNFTRMPTSRTANIATAALSLNPGRRSVRRSQPGAFRKYLSLFVERLTRIQRSLAVCLVALGPPSPSYWSERAPVWSWVTWHVIGSHLFDSDIWIVSSGNNLLYFFLGDDKSHIFFHCVAGQWLAYRKIRARTDTRFVLSAGRKYFITTGGQKEAEMHQ